MTAEDLAYIATAAVSVYAATKCIYLLWFHPLSKFPGPRLAAVSNSWYAYHWLSGRYPWAIERALAKYGDCVRIAPNELVFMTPQAFADIYSRHDKTLEFFVKTDFQNRGKNLGGIVWEEDPIRHREVAKKVSSAFSHRSIKAMEPVAHTHIDYFVQRMQEFSSATKGIELMQWMNWLTMDMSADMTTNDQMGHMKDMKDSPDLDVLIAFNYFATVIQVFKRFPLLSPLQLFFAPFNRILAFLAIQENNRIKVRRRIQERANHLDFFDFILPSGSPLPNHKDELTQIGSVSLQLMFAGFMSMSDWFYSTLFFLLEEPEYYKLLVHEIRAAFNQYEDIAPDTLLSLHYMNACLQESLRLLPSLNTGLPRLSPGAAVDGHYIPKGTHVQTSVLAQSRSPRYFYDSKHYRPQRWLSPTHPLYDTAFRNDDLKSMFSFSLGPRGCIGKELAWMEGRLFIAKVLWAFDLYKVPGQNINLDRDLLHFGFFKKPEIKVRFIPVNKKPGN